MAGIVRVLFLAVPWVGLCFFIVTFLGYTLSLFAQKSKLQNLKKGPTSLFLEDMRLNYSTVNPV